MEKIKHKRARANKSKNLSRKQKPNTNQTNNQQKTETTNDSIAEGMLFSGEKPGGEKLGKEFFVEGMRNLGLVAKLLDGYDLFGGKKVHLSFDCPENLRKLFNKAAKQKYGSVCRALRKFMAIECVEHLLKKHALHNTLSEVLPSVFRVRSVVLPTYVQSRIRRCGSFEAVGEVDEGDGRVVPFYDLDGGVWRMVRVEDDFSVNVNGHFFGCGCRMCNPKAAVKG